MTRLFWEQNLGTYGPIFMMSHPRDHPWITSKYFWTFSEPTTHYVSINIVLNQQKLSFTKNPPIRPASPFADVMKGWSPRISSHKWTFLPGVTNYFFLNLFQRMRENKKNHTLSIIWWLSQKLIPPAVWYCFFFWYFWRETEIPKTLK